MWTKWKQWLIQFLIPAIVSMLIGKATENAADEWFPPQREPQSGEEQLFPTEPRPPEDLGGQGGDNGQAGGGEGAGEAGPPPFPTGKKDKPGRQVYGIVATGKSGERLHLEVAVISHEHRWAFASANEIVDPGGAKKDFVAYLKTSGLQADLQNALDIVSIGTASCEGSPGGEEARAGRRAEKLNLWVRQVLPGSDQVKRNLYLVNLGQYEEGAECHGLTPQDTDTQRRLVLVSVLYKHGIQDRSTLQGLIEKALQAEKDSLSLDLEAYSLPFLLKNTKNLRISSIQE